MTITRRMCALLWCAVLWCVLCVCGGVTGQGTNPLANNTLNAWNPGARCVHRDDPDALLTDICSGWISHEYIYVDDLQPMRLKKIEERVLAVFSKDECVKQSFRLYCGDFYRKCEMVDLPGYGPVAIGQFMCGHMCTTRHDLCVPQFTAFGLTPAEVEYVLNCEPPWPYDFGYNKDNIYPDTLSNYTFELTIKNGTQEISGQVTATCYDENQFLLGDFDRIYCPDGTYSDGKTQCALSCPEPLITDDEYRAADIMLYIVGWISFVLMAFVVVSYLINPKMKIIYPNSLTFFFCCCIMGVSFVFVLGSFVQQENMRCEDENTPNIWGDGWCTVQGVTYVYFTLAGALWWLSIGINMLVTIAFNYKPQEKSLIQVGSHVVMQSKLIQGVLHAICWGIPLIVVIISLAAHKIGYSPSDFWCTLHSGEEIRFVLGEVFVELSGDSVLTEVDLWNLVLLTIPIFVITLTGTVILVLVFVTAWIKSRQGLKFLRHQWRLILLMFLYLYVYSFVFGYRVQITAERHSQYDEYVDFINCQKENGSNQDVCNLDTKVVYPVWIIAAFNVAGQGIFVFMIYGSSRGIAKSWGQLFVRCGLHVPKMSSDSFSSSSGSVFTGNKVSGTKITSQGSQMADEISDEDGIEMENTHATAYETEQELDNIDRTREEMTISDDEEDQEERTATTDVLESSTSSDEEDSEA